MFAPRKLVIACMVTLVMAAACASPGASSPSPSAEPVATAAATLAATAAPTPIAVLDGEPWIVYEWLQECDAGCNNLGVYLVRPDGRDRHLVLTTPAGHPDWSPDGRRLAVWADPPDDVPGTEIWTLDADGTGATVITCDGAPCGSSSWPAWSPDGGSLAFERGIRVAGEDYDRGAIVVLDLATGATHAVAMPPVADSEYTEYIVPRWSPDGTQIVFTVMRYPVPPTDENILGSSIAVVRADGSEVDAPRNLTDPALFGSYPDWSPDGQRIVFNTYPIGSFQDTTKAQNLYTIRPDGTGLTQVTHFAENDARAAEPTWTPDGMQIIFLYIERNPSNTWGERLIALIDADGSNLTLIPVPGESGHRYGTHARLRPTP